MIDSAVLVRACIGLLPVLCFLIALVAMDSYKLVRLRLVAMVIALGGASAGLSYLANIGLLGATGMDFGAVRPHARAAGRGGLQGPGHPGAGAYAPDRLPGGRGDLRLRGGHRLRDDREPVLPAALSDASLGVWIVRGFGTALLHGGVQSIFAVMLLALVDRRGRMDLGAVLPTLLAAAVLHAGFNQFVLPPIYQTLALMMLLPPLMMFVFARSESAVGDWLGAGFDADHDLLVAARLRHVFRVAARPVPARSARRAFPAKWSPTWSATCACTSNSHCAPRAC